MSALLQVTVVGPEGPVDVSIRDDRSVADLVSATLVRLGRRRRAGRWELSASGMPLHDQACLRDCRIGSGSVLELRHAGDAEEPPARTLPVLPAAPVWRVDGRAPNVRVEGAAASAAEGLPAPSDVPWPGSGHAATRSRGAGAPRQPFRWWPGTLGAAAACLVAALALSGFVVRSVRDSAGRTVTGAAPDVGPEASAAPSSVATPGSTNPSPGATTAPASSSTTSSSTTSSSSTSSRSTASTRASPAPTAGVAVAGPISNPGFERGLTGWAAGSSGTALSLTTRAHSGASALMLTRLAAAGAGDVDVDDTPDAVPTGARCNAGAWVLAPAGATVQIRLRATAPSGAFTEQETVLTGSSGSWQQVTISTAVTPLAGATTLDLHVTGVAFRPGAQLLVDDVGESCA